MKATPEQEDFCQELKSGTSSIDLNAVAGSGKTTTLVMAVNILSPGPKEVLALAFNKKNAEDLSKRMPGSVDCMTLNSLGHRAWGNRIKRKLFLNTKKMGDLTTEIVKVYNLPDSWREIKELAVKAKSVGLVPAKLASSAKVLVEDTTENWLAMADQFGIEATGVLIPPARDILISSISKALSGEIDFDDQLYMSCCWRAPMPQYKIVLADEAQDLSEIQHELVSRCVALGGRFIAVGDPKQAIYGFRGAANDSMAKLKAKFNSKSMGLTYTFRCPADIVTLAQEIVPQIKCPEGTAPGLIEDLHTEWTPKDLLESSVVLCRNVAPLIRLGFQCLKSDVSCWMVGKDIGAPIIKAAQGLKGYDSETLHNSVDVWYQKKCTEAKDNLEAKDRAADCADALHYTISMLEAKTPEEVVERLRELFSKGSGKITLSTIHRSKGMEWDKVYILDIWRIPARFVQKAAEANPESAGWMLEQEKHLKYIAFTRARKELRFIDYPKKERQNNQTYQDNNQTKD